MGVSSAGLNPARSSHREPLFAACRSERMPDELDSSGTVLPFVELTPGAYRWEQTFRSWLRRFGYYSLFPSGALR